MSYKVSSSGVFVNASGVRLMDKDVPSLRWGDGFSVSFLLPSGTVAADDKFALAVDVDRFLGNGLCVLSEEATIDVASSSVSFSGVATNTQKFLNAVNGKAGYVVGQMQLTRYVGGDITQRQTLLDDRCMLQGLVYVNGATVYILDPNAAYTKEQMDAIFSTAIVFQFSADGESWHDEQTDDDLWLRFRNPACATSEWSNSIRFMRSDIVPLVTRAENAATRSENQATIATNAKEAAIAAKNAAINAKDTATAKATEAANAATTATEKANITNNAKEAAIAAKNAAINAKDTVTAKATEAANAATTATEKANIATNAANTATAKAEAAATTLTQVNSVKSQVETLKGDVQTLKQSAVEAAQSAVTAKTTAVNAATTATQKAQAAGNAASNAAQHEATAFDAAERAQIAYQYISNNTQWIEIEINVDEQLILRQINSTFTLDINSDGQLVLTV